MDIPNWVEATLTIVGTPIAAYIAVRVAVARLEVRVEQHGDDIRRLWHWIDEHDSEDREAHAMLAVLRSKMGINGGS